MHGPGRYPALPVSAPADGSTLKGRLFGSRVDPLGSRTLLDFRATEIGIPFREPDKRCRSLAVEGCREEAQAILWRSFPFFGGIFSGCIVLHRPSDEGYKAVLTSLAGAMLKKARKVLYFGVGLW